MQRMYIRSKDINGKYEKMDPPEDIEQTFFSSYFSEKPNFTVKSIEVRLNKINLKRLQKKGEKLSYHGHDKYRAIKQKKEKLHPPR